MGSNTKARVVAIIATRFFSARLPGKVLMDVMGKPILQHIIERLRKCQLIDQIVVAIANEKDSPILAFVEKYDIENFVGDELDVLDRVYRTAKEYQAKVVVRICCDRVMIDPQVVDRVISFYLNNEVDYVSNCLAPSYPQGLVVEVFSFNALKTAWQNAKEAYQREHVTIYIYEHPEIFRLANVKNDKDLSYMRWTVDVKEDLEFAREVYRRLYRDDEVFLMDDVLALLRREPELMEINKSI